MSFMSGTTTVNDARCFLCIRLFGPLMMLGALVSLARAQAITHEVPAPIVQPAPTEDLWLVSSRRLPAPQPRCQSERELDYFQWLGGRWYPSTAEQFWATHSADRLTCVHVHGNRMSMEDAKQQGVQMYRKLACHSPGNVRLVAWTWPSDRLAGPARDIKVKEVRADAESYYLARFLSRFPQESPLSILGYSFGARSVVGSLHLLGGGAAGGYQLPNDQSVCHVHPHVVLLAAAIPADWLCPRGSRCQALRQASEFVTFFNAKDPALKIYRLTAGRPDLVGLEKLSIPQLTAVGGIVRQYNVTQSIGKSHDFEDYVNSPQLMQSIRQHLLRQNAM